MLTDVVLSSLIGVAGGYGVHRALARNSLSRVPAAIIFPLVLLIGWLLYMPASPLFVRSDGQYYLRWGRALAESWQTGTSLMWGEAFWPGNGVFPFLIGALTFFFGPVEFAIVTLNSVILVFTVVVLQKTVFLLVGVNSRLSITILILTWSPFLFFGPSMLREAFFWFGASLGALAIVMFRNKLIRGGIVTGLFSATILIAIRPDAGGMVVYGILVTALLQLIGSNKAIWVRVLAGLLILAALFSVPSYLGFIRPETVSQTSDDNLSKRTGSALAERWSGALTGDNVVTSLATEPVEETEWEICGENFLTASACGALSRAPQAFFGPFLSQVTNDLVWLMVIPSSLHFLGILGLVALFFAKSGSRSLAPLALLGIGVASLLMFAAISGNYGILVRFRTMSEIFLLPLAVGGAEQVKLWFRGSKFG